MNGDRISYQNLETRQQFNNVWGLNTKQSVAENGPHSNSGIHSPIAYRISGESSALLVMDTGATSASDSDLDGKGEDNVGVVIGSFPFSFVAIDRILIATGSKGQKKEANLSMNMVLDMDGGMKKRERVSVNLLFVKVMNCGSCFIMIIPQQHPCHFGDLGVDVAMVQHLSEGLSCSLG